MKIFSSQLLLCLAMMITAKLTAIEVDKVIIWGHKIHSHTHSYIHYAFHKAFKAFGYDVYWFDDQNHPNQKDFDYSKALFFTASSVDNNIPIREDAYYIYHHCWNKDHRCLPSKYQSNYERNKCISIKCFWKEYLKQDDDWTCLDKYIYKSIKYKELVFPWATDLLPTEIERQISKLKGLNNSKQIVYLGTMSNAGYGANQNELLPFFQAAKTSGFTIFTNDPWARPIDVNDHIKIIQASFLAPAIQGKWQAEVGYIPCRIFKNISYGQIGITNSKFVDDLFDHKIVYNADTRQLFYDALDEVKNFDIKKQIELMNFIKEKHTYINRVQLILDFFEELNNEK